MFKGRSLTGVRGNKLTSSAPHSFIKPSAKRGPGFFGAGLSSRAQNRKADEPRPCPPDGQTGLVVHGERHAAKDPWAAIRAYSLGFRSGGRVRTPEALPGES